MYNDTDAHADVCYENQRAALAYWSRHCTDCYAHTDDLCAYHSEGFTHWVEGLMDAWLDAGKPAHTFWTVDHLRHIG